MFIINTVKYGKIIHNDNGQDYIVIAKNPEKDLTLLMKANAEEPYYLVAWGLKTTSWCQGHYFMSNLEAAVKYMKGEEDHE